ncbi:stalk domain-containing protein [Paenibacillus sp. PL91]|uniref:stalk domain-containing protein n=1 Tax=Paenibacillus sp. PL91 TaxID=2729538 RepID=UPI00145C46E3|nr:stalk domain-containing protein [Paenibacillus sp. PL91]MBC9205052.1 hypothetical protein [Paenibacillus sp. PL91]
MKKWFTMAMVCSVALGSGNGLTAQAAETVAVRSEMRTAFDPAFPEILRKDLKELYTSMDYSVVLPTYVPMPDGKVFAFDHKIEAIGYTLNAYLGKNADTAATDKNLIYTISSDTDKSRSLMPEGKLYQKLPKKNDWTVYYATSEVTNSEYFTLKQKFSTAVELLPLLPNSKGDLYFYKKDGVLSVAASWSYDGQTDYRFVSECAELSFDEKFALLRSMRPVLNLFEKADAYVLPEARTLDLKFNSTLLEQRENNKKMQLSKTPFLYKGSVYLPLRDLGTLTGMEAHYVAQDQTVYFMPRDHNRVGMELNALTGEVKSRGVSMGKTTVLNKEGRLLLPVKFFSEQWGLDVVYNAENKSVTVNDSQFTTNQNITRDQNAEELTMRVLSVSGPIFLYSNKFFYTGGWGYNNLKPPTGYSSLKYSVQQISVPLIPGQNEIELTNIHTKKTIDTITLQNTLPADKVPFRGGNTQFYDNMSKTVTLSTNDGTVKVWGGGYAEAKKEVTVTGMISKPAFDSIRMVVNVNGKDSGQVVSVPSPGGDFLFKILPDKGPGIYEVSLYNPKGSLPSTEAGEMMANFVSFVIRFQ